LIPTIPGATFVRRSIITSSQTYNFSAGADLILFEVFGGGGGGGGCSNGVTHAVGGHGAAGGYVIRTVRRPTASSASITVGAGGAAQGSDGITPGGTGGGSLVVIGGTTFASAAGGQGGASSATASGIRCIQGGRPGTSTTGDVNINGYPGAASVTLSGNGNEFPQYFGGHIPQIGHQSFGSGGAGAVMNNSSGAVNGSPGFAGGVIITEYSLIGRSHHKQARRSGQAQSRAGRFIGVRHLTSGTSVTLSAATKAIFVELIGGGAGGGGASAVGSTGAYAQGGGSGSRATRYFANPAATLSYSIGAGGAGGSGMADGNAGGTTSITVGGVSLTAPGGLGGYTMAADDTNAISEYYTFNSPGGNSDFAARGAPGEYGRRFNMTNGSGGCGGSTIYGGGGIGGVNNIGNGASGTGYGSGGSGADVGGTTEGSFSGGNGAGGLIVIWEMG
jgi:hypothetical protein